MNMSATKLLIVLATLCLLGAACGSESTTDAGSGSDSDAGSDSDSSSDDSPSPAALDGEWTLVESEIDGAAFSSIADYPITLEITGDQLRGNAGCNGFGGDFTADGTALTVGDVSITEMACMAEGAMEAEQAFMQAFWQATGIERTGTGESERLIITGSAATLNFAPTALVSPPEPESALIGTLWVLDTTVQGDIASSVLADVEEPTLRLADDGTFVATTGCREMIGSYTLAAQSAVTFEYDMDDFECGGALGKQDGLIRAVMDELSAISLNDQRLTLTANEGLNALSYKAAQ